MIDIIMEHWRLIIAIIMGLIGCLIGYGLYVVNRVLRELDKCDE